MNDLIFTLNAILPIILLILLGYILKRINFFQDDFIKVGNKLCFKVFLPALLFYNIYEIEGLGDINPTFILYTISVIILLFCIGLLVVHFTIPDVKQKGVVLQTFFRSNYGIIGISLAASLASALSAETGVKILANAALASAFTVPIFNVLAVIVLSVFDKTEGNRISVKEILKRIITNPLIVGVFSGLFVLAIRSVLVSFDITFTIKKDLVFVYQTIKNLGSVASTLALIVLGGAFEFKAISRLKKQIIIGCCARVVFVPAVSLIGAYLVGLSTYEFPALIGIFATPIAVSSVPMAAEMKQDDQLAGQLVVWTTLTSSISLFVIIMACRLVSIF